MGACVVRSAGTEGPALRAAAVPQGREAKENFRELKVFGIRLLSSVIRVRGRRLELGDLQGPFQPKPFHGS